MIDISHKHSTLRSAVARGTLRLGAGTAARIRAADLPKGDPLPVARVAAVQAVKDAARLIPFCHPVPIDWVGVVIDVHDDHVEARVTVRAVAKTGMEMEALTGASIAVLTIYDMCKMFDDDMAITGVELVEKKGGKSDYRTDLARPLRAAVLICSDSVAAGRKTDSSGRAIAARLEREGIEVADVTVVPDEAERIANVLAAYADELRLDLVLTTGGTGFSPRDCTPEAMDRVIERDIPGIPEAMRVHGMARTPYAMLSRARAGIRGGTIVVNLPGSRRGVEESLDALFPALQHAFPMLWMEGSWSETDAVASHRNGRAVGESVQ